MFGNWKLHSLVLLHYYVIQGFHSKHETLYIFVSKSFANCNVIGTPLEITYAFVIRHMYCHTTNYGQLDTGRGSGVQLLDCLSNLLPLATPAPFLPGVGDSEGGREAVTAAKYASVHFSFTVQ